MSNMIINSYRFAWPSYVVPTTWLVGEYLLDWDATDTSGNGNDGTGTNVTYTTPAWSSVQVWSFNGSSSYVTCMTNWFGTHDNQEFTVVAWIYRDTGWNNTIWSYDFTSHAAPYYSQHLRTSTVASTEVAYMWYNLSWVFSASSQTYWTWAIPAAERTMIAMQFESWTQTIYVGDDTSLTSYATSTNVGTITYYNQEVWIGRPNFGTGYFDWYIARVRSYDRVLISDELEDLRLEWVDLLWL